MQQSLWVHAGTLITPRCRYENVTLLARNGTIYDLIPGEAPSPAPGDAVIDAREHIVGPGFVDLHVHGGGGHDAMDATPEALAGLCAFHAQHGTTALLPSTVAAPAEEVHHALAAMAEAMDTADGGARILGAHVEGPFLSREKRGAHLARHVRAPEMDHEPWLFEHLGTIRRVTLAPELPGALDLIRQLRGEGILVSLGHSTAGEELVSRAVLAGATHVTHLFNAMSTMEKVGALRRVGLAEAALVHDGLSIELIADGWHVPPAAMRLAVRAKGIGRTALVTDAMRAAGLPEGRYALGSEDGMGVTVRDGMALTDEGGLAGSIATMSELLRRAVQFIDLSLEEAWQMASLTPARILGVDDRIGELAVGRQADLAILNRDLQVVATVVAGHTVYQREE